MPEGTVVGRARLRKVGNELGDVSGAPHGPGDTVRPAARGRIRDSGGQGQLARALRRRGLQGAAQVLVGVVALQICDKSSGDMAAMAAPTSGSISKVMWWPPGVAATGFGSAVRGLRPSLGTRARKSAVSMNVTPSATTSRSWAVPLLWSGYSPQTFGPVSCIAPWPMFPTVRSPPMVTMRGRLCLSS
jgi:hypothetical protein